MFDSRQMEYIIAIDDCHSLSKAADKLYLSQSALSQQLVKLKESGLPPLFQYKNGQMNTTIAGKLYLNGARTIMNLKDEFMRSISDDAFTEK
ncbi:MAG: LysR family transcriptional regulator [Eubacteriales bacterium]|nr:LysR family transcriptional regulator [Eubacteriales bacterium]